MQRRSFLASIIAAISSVLPVRAGAAACPLFGRHRFVFDHNEPGPQGTYGQWWWEFSKCKCGAEARELVASPRG